MEIVIISIAIIVAFILYKKKKKELVWWEYVIFLGGSISLYLLLKLFLVKLITTDTEFLGGYITKTTYYEPWNEKVTVTKTKTDSDGNTITYEEEEIKYHYEKYTYNTNLDNNEIRCSKKEHEEIKRLFGVYPEFKDMHRKYYTEDGDSYVYNWNKSDLTMRTITKTNLYKNPMKCSNSIFRLTKGKKDSRLFDYPEIERKDQRVILGIKKTLSDQRLRVLNSKLGKNYQIRVFLLVFPESYGIKTAIDQKNYWEGGNKNELVICVGVKNDSVKWCYPFSWCDNPEVETKIKAWYIDNPKFNITALCDYLDPTIRKYWVRKEFKDFDYITTDISIGYDIILFILVLIYMMAIGYWITTNEYN